MSRSRLTTSLLVALLAAPAAAQQPLDPAAPLPMDPAVTVGTLPNGIRYYVRTNERPENRAELRLVVNAGSVLEDDDQLGLAHLAEHMAFNGTENFERQELVDYLERIGMRFGPDINAYTSFDETVYMLQVPTDSPAIVTTAFQILEDWAHRVSFDSGEVDKERGVVIEEWRLGRGANARIFDQQLPVLFRDSRYAERLPIGEKEVLESFPQERLVQFYRDWYRPDLMAVVAVGDFDSAVIERLIRQHFGAIPAAAGPRPRTLFPVPDHDEPLFAIATDREATNTSVGIYFKRPVERDTTLAGYRRSLVESLYHGMLNARLGELAQQADPPFIGAGSGSGRLIRTKQVYFLGAAVKDDAIARGLDALLTEAERVTRHGFAATELERQKAEVLRAYERAFAERDKTESARYASEYVSHYLQGEPSPGIAFEYDAVRRLLPGIRLEEVNALARGWITDRNRVVLVGAPEKADVAVPGEAELGALFAAVEAKRVEPYVDAVTDAPLVAEVPQPARIVEEETHAAVGVTEWTLANGVRVLLKPTDFKADEIVFRAWSPGGSSLAPDSAYLSAALASSLQVQSGVGALSLVDLQKALAGKTVQVTPFIGSLEEGFAGGASPKDLETLFQLIYLHVTAPRLDSTAFASFTQRMHAVLENRAASPEQHFSDTVQVVLTQGHFRGRPLSAELLGEIELAEAHAFFRDRFRDVGDFTFIFVGAFQLDSMRPLVQRWLGALPSASRRESWRDTGLRYPGGVIRKTVRKGVEPKARIQVTYTGPFEFDLDRGFELDALAEVLRIRLRETLREEQSGTYSVSVSESTSRDPNPDYAFTVAFTAEPGRIQELMSVARAEIEKIQRDGPTADEIDKVGEIMRRARETRLRENTYWLGQIVAADRYFDLPSILTLERRIDALNAPLVQSAARRYLRPDNYIEVVLMPEDYQ